MQDLFFQFWVEYENLTILFRKIYADLEQNVPTEKTNVVIQQDLPVEKYSKINAASPEKVHAEMKQRTPKFKASW